MTSLAWFQGAPVPAQGLFQLSNTDIHCHHFKPYMLFCLNIGDKGLWQAGKQVTLILQTLTILTKCVKKKTKKTSEDFSV